MEDIGDGNAIRSIGGDCHMHLVVAVMGYLVRKFVRHTE
jgi:hypothetical protein